MKPLFISWLLTKKIEILKGYFGIVLPELFRNVSETIPSETDFPVPLLTNHID